MSYNEYLFDLPEEVEQQQKTRGKKAKTPLLPYTITFVNDFTGTRATVTLLYENDRQFKERFANNYKHSTPVEVFKINIKKEKIKVI